MTEDLRPSNKKLRKQRPVKTREITCRHCGQKFDANVQVLSGPCPHCERQIWL